jgi:hypothetical protein
MDPRRSSLLALALAATLACRSDGDPSESAAAREAAALGFPWTRAFQEPALLIADEVYVEGPVDLLDHLALRQEPAVTDYETKTTEEGLRQVLSIKPGIGGAELRAQLDAWQLVAMRRLVVLQRPAGDAPVLLRAGGNVYWSRPGADEVRRERLEFRGDRGR